MMHIIVAEDTMLEKMIKNETAKKAAALDRWMTKHNAENPLPPDVVLTANVDYIGDGAGCHMMDIYRPSDVTGKLPVLVDIHGGGFLLGKKEANGLFAADMCRRGFIVFCPEYPLVPDTDIFGIFRALAACINRIASIAGEYGGDATRLFLCGDSAGAHLCVYLAAMRKNSDMARAAGVEPIVPEIRALGLQSGMFYTTLPDQVGLFLPSMIYGKDRKKDPFFKKYAVPDVPDITKKLPPCFVVTARGDFLRNYSRRFAAALEKSGAEYAFLDIDEDKKLPHAFAAMLPETEAAKRANAAMAEFFGATEA